jgi:nucleoside-diphosphate-sugar epimerase
MGFQVSDVQIDFECFSGRIGQYLFISSTTVYSKPHVRIPLTEETRPGNPHSEYARRKEMCEAWLMIRLAKSGYPVTVVRPSHTYSRGWIPNPVFSDGIRQSVRWFREDPARQTVNRTANELFARVIAAWQRRQTP